MSPGYVGILNVELHFPEAGSLKAKRRYVKSAKAQLQNRFGAAVAEVAHHELWQRSQLVVAFVTREHVELERLIEDAVRFLSSQEYELLWHRRNIADVEGVFSEAIRTSADALEGVGWDGDLDALRSGDPIEEIWPERES